MGEMDSNASKPPVDFTNSNYCASSTISFHRVPSSKWISVSSKSSAPPLYSKLVPKYNPTIIWRISDHLEEISLQNLDLPNNTPI